MVKCLLIAYFIGNISAEKHQNPFTGVKVIASQMWDVFERHGVYSPASDDRQTKETKVLNIN